MNSISVKDFLLRATACVKASNSVMPQTGGAVLPEADLPVLKDLGNGLCVVYLVDTDDSLLYVQNHHLAGSNLTPEGLHELGLHNLAERVSDKTRMQQHGAVYGLFADGLFEASLILLDNLWDETLAHLAPNGFIAALPSRDVLAVCDAASGQGIESLNSLAKRVFEGGDHVLAPVLYRRQNGRWLPLEHSPAAP